MLTAKEYFMNQILRFGLLCVLFSFLSPARVFAAGSVTVMDEAHLRAALVGGGTVTFAADGTIALANSLSILSTTTLDGTGHAVTLSGNNAVRVLTVNNPITLSLLNLTVSNGLAAGANGGAGLTGGPGQGGGVLLNSGTLIASNCQFVANTALGGNGGSGGANGGAAYGGALSLINGTLRATNCQFFGNSATGGLCTFSLKTNGSAYGGAIYAATSTVTLASCQFQTNQASGGTMPPGMQSNQFAAFGKVFGGAVCAQGSSVTNSNGLFAGNSGSSPAETAAFGTAGNLAQGGAVFADGGSLAVSGTTFVSNNITGGSAGSKAGGPGPGQGGAIYSHGPLQVSTCTFSQNSATGGDNGTTAANGEGGAIYSGAAATLSQSWFSSNSVSGGAAYANFTSALASGVGRGGAVFNTNSLAIVACTFSDNSAEGQPGGPFSTNGDYYAPSSAFGGAIFNTGSCAITNATLFANLALGGLTINTNGINTDGANAFGGGIYNAGGTVVSVNNTFAQNDAEGGTGLTNGTGFGGGIYSTTNTTLVNTILTNGPSSSNCFGVLIDAGHNLSSDASCNFTNTGSLNNTDPLVGSLANNGGPTLTAELLAGSPAIDAGDTAAAPPTDQRGIVRPVGPAADIGAFEYYATLPACSYLLSQTNATFSASGGSGTLNVTANYYCSWTASSDTNWLTITSATNGTGVGSVNYAVAVNSSTPIFRTGTLTLGGQTFTVTQSGTDAVKPTVTITAPAANSRQTNSPVAFQGTAQDNIGLAAVEYRLENAGGVGAYQTAVGTNTWTASVSGLLPGTNTVRVRARDLNGNLSAEVTRTVVYVVMSPLSLTITGAGTVTPNLNGQSLQIGNSFTVTAKPAAGNIFSNWTGNVVASMAKLTFTMQSNMVLEANFTTNAFLPVQGQYNGLILDTTNLMHSRSGFFSLKLSSPGTLSGTFTIGGHTYATGSQFVGPDGQIELKFFGGSPRQQLMTAELQFDLTAGTGQVNGTLSDARLVGTVPQPATWISELSGDRAGFFTRTNPPAAAGPYTVDFPGGDGVTEPAGHGFGLVSVDGLGAVRLTGFLAEGTSISQRTSISKTGRWPLFVNLYGGTGSLIGWMNFTTNLPGSDVSGTPVWTKPANSFALYYPAGFVDSLETTGSRYVAPKGSTNNVLSITNGIIDFTGGNLGAPFADTFTLAWNGKVTNPSGDKLILTITPSTGLFQGSVAVPGTNTVLKFKGVVVQDQTWGYGYFLNGRQSGQVFLTQ